MEPGTRAWPYQEAALWKTYTEVIGRVPMPSRDVLVRNLGLFSTPGLIRRLLMFHHLTSLLVDVPGAWVEFGVQWGRDLTWWTDLRTFHPFRWANTQIVGFDTFAGHRGSTERDGDHKNAQDGAFAVPEGYSNFLVDILNVHAAAYPTGEGIHLIEGDVRDTLPIWLDEYDGPAALVYLDLDLYEPTRFVLEQIWDRVPSGGIVGLDEYVTRMYPGETRAVADTLGVDARWRWSPFGPWAYLVKP